MAFVKVHYTKKKNAVEVVETGFIRGKTRGECFHNSMAVFGHCIGKAVDEDGNTTSWMFSQCEKTETGACVVNITHCEIL